MVVRERRFVWSPVRPGSSSDVVPEETVEALRWLGRRLAFEQWLEVLRGAHGEHELEAASA